MDMEVPPVVSPVGVNSEIVEHDRNGLLAATPQEWVACLDILLADEELRRTLGKAARRTVEERYSAAVTVPKIARLFKEVAA
jgi:glycosyltransferase involved in cell wall biosynthesis